MLSTTTDGPANVREAQGSFESKRSQKILCVQVEISEEHCHLLREAASHSHEGPIPEAFTVPATSKSIVKASSKMP